MLEPYPEMPGHGSNPRGYRFKARRRIVRPAPASSEMAPSSPTSGIGLAVDGSLRPPAAPAPAVPAAAPAPAAAPPPALVPPAGPAAAPAPAVPAAAGARDAGAAGAAPAAARVAFTSVSLTTVGGFSVTMVADKRSPWRKSVIRAGRPLR